MTYYCTRVLLLTFALVPCICHAEDTRPRLIVMADMGNEPDEQQQMIHLLMCSNAVRLEGLLAVSGIHLHPGHPESYRHVLHPELFHQLIDGYAQVLPQLRQHANHWHEPEYLHSIVKGGQFGYGMQGTGQHHSTEGSQWIIRVLTADDPAPVHVVANAGSSTLAQAIMDYRRTHTTAEVSALIAKLRVYENSAQDNAGAWICHKFPDIHWIRSNHQTRGFGGPDNHNVGPHVWKPFAHNTKGQDDWAHHHVRTGHGLLGALYPIRIYGDLQRDNPAFLEGGGTIPWMRLVSPGLTDPNQPTWGGWSGRFTSQKITNVPSSSPGVGPGESGFRPWAMHTDAPDRWIDPATGKQCFDKDAGIWPWRQAMWNDFQARMDWCVKPPRQANHHPTAVLNSDTSDKIIRRTARIGDRLGFDGSGSFDPDGDPLRFVWWIYREAGQRPYQKLFPLDDADRPRIQLTIPPDAAGKELHLILEVWDKSKIVPLVDYRRVVITVQP